MDATTDVLYNVLLVILGLCCISGILAVFVDDIFFTRGAIILGIIFLAVALTIYILGHISNICNTNSLIAAVLICGTAIILLGKALVEFY